MLLGKILTDRHGWRFYWDNNWPGFRFEDEKGDVYPMNDFSGLYAELKGN
jgi:hypothetical protein